MKITVCCVGRIKEKFYTEAISEYKKRLSRYCNIDIIEVADEKTPDNASDKQCLQIKETEGERLLAKIPSDSYCIVLDIAGKKMDSVSLAKKLSQIMTYESGNISFVIGGSLGLSEAVKNRADMSLSFSDMTFPHQLMRVILLEQVYRCFRINNNEPYHK